MKTYQAISRCLESIGDCCRRWEGEDDTAAFSALDLHRERLEKILKEAPRGSGIDSGITLIMPEDEYDIPAVTKYLKFKVPYHKMNPNGYYCGWVDYYLYVKPSLSWEVEFRLTGRDYNGVKDYLTGVLINWLEKEYAW